MSYRNSGARHRFSPYPRRSGVVRRPRQVSDDYSSDEVSYSPSNIPEVKKERVTVWIRVPADMTPDVEELERRFQNDREFDYVFWNHDDAPPTFVHEIKSVILISNDAEHLKKMFTATCEFAAKNVELSLICHRLSDIQKKELEKTLDHHLPFYWHLPNAQKAVIEHLMHISSTKKWQRMDCDWKRKSVLVWIGVAQQETISKEWMKDYELSNTHRYHYREVPRPETLAKSETVILVTDTPEKLEAMYAATSQSFPKDVHLFLLKKCSWEEKERLKGLFNGKVPRFMNIEPEFYEPVMELVLIRFEEEDQNKERRATLAKQALQRNAEREAEVEAAEQRSRRFLEQLERRRAN